MRISGKNLLSRDGGKSRGAKAGMCLEDLRKNEEIREDGAEGAMSGELDKVGSQEQDHGGHHRL